MYDSERRLQKAGKALEVISTDLATRGRRRSDQRLLDIGCSTGYMSQLYSKHFREVVGIDIDEAAIAHATSVSQHGNLRFEIGDAMSLSFESGCFDVVTCSHVYEHVPDSSRLLAEIERVLSVGGICYFAAANRFRLVEPHYHLPILGMLPKTVADRYVRWSGRADSYYESHLWFSDLKKLTSQFIVRDYTRAVIEDPERFHATDLVTPHTLRQRLALGLNHYLPGLMPTYIWILEKPKES